MGLPSDESVGWTLAADEAYPPRVSDFPYDTRYVPKYGSYCHFMWSAADVLMKFFETGVGVYPPDVCFSFESE